MPGLKDFCNDMQRCPHVMTFTEIGEALTTGAIVGHKSGVPGGIVIGAVLGLCVEAGNKVKAISEDLLTEQQRKQKMKRLKNQP